VLINQIQHYKEMLHNGDIESSHANMILDELNRYKGKLNRHEPKVNKIDPLENLRESEIREIFTTETINKFVENTNFEKELIYRADETISKKGSKGMVYLVKRGIVHEQSKLNSREDMKLEKSMVTSDAQPARRRNFGQGSFRLALHFESGEIVGLQNILQKYEDEPVTDTFVDKSHLTRVIPLDVTVLRQELQTNNEVMRKYWKTLAPMMVFSHHFEDDLYPFFLKNMTFKKLKSWMNDETKATIDIYSQG